jgi:hypothetical protein
MFEAIRMQYTARCLELPGCASHHACLESVRTFRQAIMQWVQKNLGLVVQWYPDAQDPNFVNSIAKHKWGGDLELAATVLQCDIQIIPMKGSEPILVTPLTVTGSRGPLRILGWMNDRHYTSNQPRKSRSALPKSKLTVPGAQPWG